MIIAIVLKVLCYVLIKCGVEKLVMYLLDYLFEYYKVDKIYQYLIKFIVGFLLDYIF